MAGASYDLVFDVSIAIVTALRDVAVLVDETVGWAYHRDLDQPAAIPAAARRHR